MKLHVHTLNPGVVLELATDVGELVRVKVDNMQLQHAEFAQRQATESPGADGSFDTRVSTLPGCSVVAIASGDGFAAIFESYGALVVPGGPTVNPSVRQIADAIARADRADVVVLPNNRNVVMAARQAEELASDRNVTVLPTDNLAQGLAATLAVNPELDAGGNRPQMEGGRCTVPVHRADAGGAGRNPRRARDHRRRCPCIARRAPGSTGGFSSRGTCPRP